MTTKELIEALQKMPPNAIIETEGCDCMGDCNSVSFDAKYNKVVLWRSDGDGPYTSSNIPSISDSEEEIVILEEESKKLSDLE